MTACPHTPKYPDLVSMPTMQDALSRCSIVEDDESVKKQRALTAADGQTTRIDAGYWQGLSDAQKCAVVAHERAHPTLGMEVDCEGCADKIGGYYMRAWGYAPQLVREAYSTLNVRRGQDQGDITDNAMTGVKAAERALAARGLLGVDPRKVTTLLQSSVDASKQTVATTSTTKLTAPATSSTTSVPATPVVPATPPPAGGADGGKVAAPASTPVPAAATTLDPGGPPPAGQAAPTAPAPTGTAADPGAPSQDAPAGVEAAVTQLENEANTVAGDVVSAVLGEEARPHAGKVLIAAGVAAVVAAVLVVLVRRG